MKDKDAWSDEIIEGDLNKLLKVESNGRWLTPDITSHFAYFYNTLNCAMSVENPFAVPWLYPALGFRSEGSISLESPDKKDLRMVN